MALLQPNRGMLLAPMVPPSMEQRMTSPSLFPRDDDLIELLSSHEFDVKLKTLTRLSLLTKKDPNWFSTFARKGDLFKQLERALQDERWEVQHQCIKFLHEALPTFGNNVEWCLSYLMPNIVDKLGSAKVTVRRVAAQLLAAYTGVQPAAAVSVQRMIFDFAKRRPSDARIRRDLLNELPNLFVPEVEHADWSITVDGLTRMLTTAADEERQQIMQVLQKLSAFISPTVFDQLLSHLPANQKTAYGSGMGQMRGDGDEQQQQQQRPRKLSMTRESLMGEMSYRFGIVPIQITNMLNNDNEPAIRLAGLEKLKAIIETVSSEDIARLGPHLHSYLVTLGNVLDDLNFKVVVLALDLVRVSVEQLGIVVEAHVQHIISIISKHFGNQKAVIKQLIMMICMDLMKDVQPKNVIAYLCVYLDHRNSRVREEILNIMTASLMTFTNAKLNLSALSNVLAPMLIDPKRRVRLAAFEQLSVLAYVMHGRLEALMRCIRDVEQKNRAFGLLNAVHARLSRHLLPRIRYDGLIDYSVPPAQFLDASMNGAGGTMAEIADSHSGDEHLDFDWIMRANVGPGSAFHRSLQATASAVTAVILPVRKEAQIMKKLSTMEKKLPWESDLDDDNSPVVENRPITRMNSDDHIVRNRTAAQKITRPVSGALRATPSASTSSWQSPLDRSRSRLDQQKQHNRATSAQHNGLHKSYASSTFSDPTIEVNNNEIASSKPPKASHSVFRSRWNPAAIARTKSDGHLASNNVNDDDDDTVCAIGTTKTTTKYDDMPIRPARNQTYEDDGIDIPNGALSIVPSRISNGHPSAIVPQQKITAIKKKSQSQLNVSTSNGHAKIANGITVKKTKPMVPVKNAVKSAISNGHGHHSDEMQRKLPIFTPEMLKRPEQIVTAALHKMESEEWTDKVDGIQMITVLVKASPDTVASAIHPITVAVLNECKNLRSSVSRVAIGCFGTLFNVLRTTLDPEVEKICMVLMQKSGDVSSAFIREDAMEALEQMVLHASTAKVMPSMIAAGAKSKTNTIRAGCSQFLCKLIQRPGAVGNLLGNREAFEKLINQLLTFSKDPQPAVRYHGKWGISLLNKDPSAFDRAVRKNLSDSEQRAVKEILDNIKKKGLGDSGGGDTCFIRNGSVRKSAAAPARKLPDSLQLDLDEIRKALNAASWEQRIEALKRFDQMCSTNPKAVASDTNLVEAFITRLDDLNGKVALEALETHILTVPQLSPYYASESGMRAMLTPLAAALMAQLASKQEDVRQLAIAGIEETIKHIDASALSSPFCAAAKTANVKQKPLMLSSLLDIHEPLYRSKPKQVETNAVPILWDLLRSPAQNQSDADVRHAVIAFARGMADVFGHRQLLEMAAGAVKPEHRHDLEAMIA